MSSELEDILAAFSRLVEEHEASREGPAEEDPENFRCTDCVDCVACRFCTACERCSNCTYCDACSDCADCTQSRECIACAECSQSNLSAYCERSSYLTLCLDCEGCVQCFGCVGLTDAEFHILNKPYKRSVYFKKVAELRKLLDVKLTEGWQPPWVAEVELETSASEDAEVDEEPEVEDEPAPEQPEVADEPEPEEVEPEPEVAEEPESEPEDEPEPEPEVEEPEPEVEESEPAVESPAAAPRRIDPYTDRTSRLVDPMEHSWPPVDAASARSMDQADDSPWEDLFEPDELPPPRPRASEPKPAETTTPAGPKPGRFERLIAETTGTKPAQRSEPPASFLGEVPEPPAEATEAEEAPRSASRLRRAKRPPRR